MTVAYLSDHGQGCGVGQSDDFIPDEVLELCDGVDLLIHDAQHTPERVRDEAPLGPLHGRLRAARRQAVGRAHGGAVPPRPRARRRQVDQLEREAQDHSAAIDGAEVVAAAEGMVLRFPTGT